MNETILELLHGRVAQTLGWTLMHSLWQLALLGGCWAAALGLMRRATAGARYVVAGVGLAVMLAVPAGTFGYLLPPAPAAVVRGAPVAVRAAAPADPGMVALAAPAVPARVTAPPAALRVRIKRALEPLLPGAVGLYLLGAGVVLLRLVIGYGRVRGILAGARALRGPALERLELLAQRMRVRQTVRLLESAAIEVPTLIGALKPVILLPATALTGLSAEQLAALLAHELAHIRRYDYLVNMVQSGIETVLFYHPAVWWVGSRMRQEREHCCDDAAVAATSNRLEYARALAAMEALRIPGRMALAAGGAGGGSLVQRIARLLGGVPQPRPRRFLTTSAALVVMLAGALVYIGCNRAAPPASSATATSTASATAATQITLGANQTVHTFDIRYLLGPATSDRQSRQEAVRALMDTIQAVVAPDSWQARGGTGELRESDGQLTVIQSAENLAQVDNLLGQLFKSRAAMGVDVDMRILLVSNNFMDDFRVGWDANLPVKGAALAAPANNASIIDNWTLNLLLSATQADRRTITVSAPRLTTPNGYPAHIDLNVPQAAAATPAATEAHSDASLAGVGLDFTPNLSADNRYVVLSNLRLQRSKTPLGRARPDVSAGAALGGAELQMPKIPLAEPSTMISIPDGGTLLVDGGPVGAAARGDPGTGHLLILVRPKVRTAEEALFKAAGSMSAVDHEVPRADGTGNASPDRILVKAVLANVDDALWQKMSAQLDKTRLQADSVTLGGMGDLSGSISPDAIVSRPQILLDGAEEGVITIGDVVPIVKGFHDDPAGGRVADVEEVQTGLKLGVRARRVAGKGAGAAPEIQLDVDATWTQLLNSDTGAALPPGVPGSVVDQRHAKTTVTTADNTSILVLWPIGSDVAGKARKPMLLELTPRFVTAGDGAGN